jgi:2-hydroxy-3-oxopropionate reductase
MVGGERAVYEAALPVLEAMGRLVTYIGGAGMGLVAKYVNQMLMEAAFCAAAEAFAMAAGAGADLAAVYAAVRGGLGGSRVLDQAVPQFLSGDFGGGRELSLHHKDGGYALAAAEAVGSQAPLTALTHELFAAAVAAGQGGHSAAAVARVYEARNGRHFVGKGE